MTATETMDAFMTKLRRSTLKTLLALMILGCIAFAGGCGKKAPPEPPLKAATHVIIHAATSIY